MRVAVVFLPFLSTFFCELFDFKYFHRSYTCVTFLYRFSRSSFNRARRIVSNMCKINKKKKVIIITVIR